MALDPCRELSDLELSDLSDEELVDYIKRMRDCGNAQAALQGLRVLVYGYEGKLRSFVRGKIPSEHVDDVLNKVLDSGFTSVFDEDSIESFRSWIFTIARYRVADFYKKERPELTALPEEHELDDEIFGEVQSVEDETGFIEVKEAFETCLERLEKPEHRRVVELAVFAQLPAREICEHVNEEFPDLKTPMSEQNVDKIKSRFRKCLRGELDE
jgi:RNA polymerase sigma factor (sigma-70 family)